jgi:hypothetical protein
MRPEEVENLLIPRQVRSLILYDECPHTLEPAVDGVSFAPGCHPSFA